MNTKDVPLLEVDARYISDKMVISGLRENSDFAAMGAGKGMFGAFGAIAMISAGNEIVQKNNTEDPAAHIGKV